MRILVLGAGGTGGYFGGRLAQAGVDVTFLVRPARAAQLAREGLRLRSPLGDADVAVAHVTADALPALAATRPFDLAILSCKAYDLDSAVEAIAPAVGDGTAVMPILNGLLHYAVLDARFGAARVLGGLCFISAVKGADGEVVHLPSPPSLTFGERDPARNGSARMQALADACARADGFEAVRSDDFLQAAWNKFSFLATLASATCLMRASVGRIVAADDGAAFMAALHDECLAVAAAQGHAIPAQAAQQARSLLTREGSPATASMLRDLESGQDVEAAQIVGDMRARARDAGIAAPMLQAAWVHLQCYRSRRATPDTP
ncbi:2-dehydropantoate 2-reductase [Luteimonas sp. FCS-9]|uniref:2-dehydropantoate 2-reductase n=1 Tax=Luteimonas sp. FCS-9 TaxID=1547516 RepID=UPI00063E9C4B|nr:2-dehydropantoate 2-reductase [Luteimonas sp. FCS-9]KLI98301.1 2-dehydropantoate 2-reductase [Luteimonas sp. FCS-9]